MPVSRRRYEADIDFTVELTRARLAESERERDDARKAHADACRQRDEALAELHEARGYARQAQNARDAARAELEKVRGALRNERAWRLELDERWRAARARELALEQAIRQHRTRCFRVPHGDYDTQLWDALDEERVGLRVEDHVDVPDDVKLAPEPREADDEDGGRR